MFKVQNTYMCEVCGKEFDKRSDANWCEYMHMGFKSMGQVNQWKHLKEEAKMAGFTVSEHHNLETLDAYDKAVERLVEFEQRNGITSLFDLLLKHNVLKMHLD